MTLTVDMIFHVFVHSLISRLTFPVLASYLCGCLWMGLTICPRIQLWTMIATAFPDMVEFLIRDSSFRQRILVTGRPDRCLRCAVSCYAVVFCDVCRVWILFMLMDLHIHMEH